MRKLICSISGIMLMIMIGFGMIQNEKSILQQICVTIATESGTETICCWEDINGAGYFFLPSYADLSKTELMLLSDSQIFVDSVRVEDGMQCDQFELNVPYELVYSTLGKEQRRRIVFTRSGGVATMYIDTQSGNMDYIHSGKGNAESGVVRLYTEHGNLDYRGQVKNLKGRGNSTWVSAEKKPYVLDLAHANDLLGMGSAEKWILLANAVDVSNIKNKMIYDFAKEIGMKYSPDSQWVDLYLNGEYAGLYLLTEKNEVSQERVNIEGEGNFLVSLQLATRILNDTSVTTQAGQTLRVEYVSDTSEESIQMLADIWQSVENAILSVDGYDYVTGKHWTELIDLDSWVRKYLIEEVFANHDGGYISQYFYRDTSLDNEKIYAGPVWDYDLAMDYLYNEEDIILHGFIANRLNVKAENDTPWFHMLYSKKDFYDRMTDIYEHEFLPLLNVLIDEKIDSYVECIQCAAESNHIRWEHDIGRIGWVKDGTVNELSEDIKKYMNNRIDFLTSAWVDGVEYHSIRADIGYGENYAYFAVESGKCLSAVPMLADTEAQKFIGWFYEDTGEAFDISREITDDVKIYAKWEGMPQLLSNRVEKLIPLGIYAGMMIIIIVVSIRRMKQSS